MPFCEVLIKTFCLSVIIPFGAVDGRKVLLISMDGFRHDYFEKTNTPHFDAMIASGVKVPYVNNTFVTLTFPSHTSIATGLYEESHGIIDNHFYDPLYNETFSMRSLEPKWWNASEPIWTNAARNGLKVGTFFWPGTEVEHDGIQPTSFRKYNGRVCFEERIRTAVKWLSRDDYDFAITYFNQPDHGGHEHGPDSPEVTSAIRDMDDILGLLMLMLENAQIKNKTDVIVTSDHGMTAIDMVNKTVAITDYVNETLLDKVIPNYGAAMNILPMPNKSQEIIEALKNVDHIHAFLKEDIPDHFHYRNNRRIMPVFVYADEGWLLIKNKQVIEKADMKGTHGYDNALMSMKPIFVASGPSFKKGFQLPGPIKSVDIYPLLCHLLNISAAPNNGSLDRVMPLLAVPATEPTGPIGSPEPTGPIGSPEPTVPIGSPEPTGPIGSPEPTGPIGSPEPTEPAGDAAA